MSLHGQKGGYPDPYILPGAHRKTATTRLSSETKQHAPDYSNQAIWTQHNGYPVLRSTEPPPSGAQSHPSLNVHTSQDRRPGSFQQNAIMPSQNPRQHPANSAIGQLTAKSPMVQVRPLPRTVTKSSSNQQRTLHKQRSLPAMKQPALETVTHQGRSTIDPRRNGNRQRRSQSHGRSRFDAWGPVTLAVAGFAGAWALNH